LISNSAEFLEAVHSREPVTGFTHSFYRYPARFSPLFARAAISTFTQAGDLIVDPFMGSGTTLVEARVSGRRAIGTDISTLAHFVSEAKTTLYRDEDLNAVRTWATTFACTLNLHAPPKRATEWIERGYQRNINGKSTWPMRKALELALSEVNELENAHQRMFARCILLRTAQWALDCRERIPGVKQFRHQLVTYAEEMVEGASSYTNAVRNNTMDYVPAPPFLSLCLNRSADGLDEHDIWSYSPAPALVLTSPPYPGVHVLYHRWQVQGRRETPAPFWIADRLDGNGAAFYTFGDRHAQELTGYFEQIRACFSALARVASRDTLVVQMVAFSDPSWQLSRYLRVMEEAGFAEQLFPGFANSGDGRLRRCVPNRKWYADHKGAISASKEVVLFHRLRPDNHRARLTSALQQPHQLKLTPRQAR
jgi:hypothetical protein